jgi:hypothetical protein
MNFIKRSSMFVFLIFAGIVSVALGCGGGGQMVNNDVHNPPGFAPTTQITNTTLQILVVDGSTGHTIAGATFSWTPLASYSGLDQPPSWFFGTAGPGSQTDANGMITISGTASLPNHDSTVYDHSLAYEWTCSAPNYQPASGSQEFPPSSWIAYSSERSVQVSTDTWNGVLNQRVVLNP